MKIYTVVQTHRHNYAAKDKYQQYLTHKLHHIPELNVDVNATEYQIQTQTDSYIDALNDAIHTSAKAAGCISSRQFTPKPYSGVPNYRLYGT